MSGLRILLLFVMPVLLVPGLVFAEKADRQQVLRMSARQGSAEGSKETNVKMLEGDVLITQGTMRITADRAIIKESDGVVFAELFGSGSSQVTFRQKRDGESEFVDATADRAEYEDKSGVIKLFSKVKFKSGGDLVDSEYMQYNTNTEKMELRNQVPGAKARTGPNEGRVTFEVQPRGQGEKKTGESKPSIK